MSHLEPCSATAKSISNKWIGHGNGEREWERVRSTIHTRHIIPLVLWNQSISHSLTHTLFLFVLFFLLKSESLSIAPRKHHFIAWLCDPSFASSPSTVLHCLVHFLSPIFQACCPGNPTQIMHYSNPEFNININSILTNTFFSYAKFNNSSLGNVF